MTHLEIISSDIEKDIYDKMEELPLDENTMEIFQFIKEKIEQKCETIIASFNQYNPKLKINYDYLRSEHESRKWGLSSFETFDTTIEFQISRYTGGGHTDRASFTLSNKILNLSSEQIDEFFKSYNALEEKNQLEKLLNQQKNQMAKTIKI